MTNRQICWTVDSSLAEIVPDGEWRRVTARGEDPLAPPRHLRLRVAGAKIELFLSAENPGVWLMSCSWEARFEVVGKLREDDAKIVALVNLEALLAAAAARAGSFI